MKSIKWHNHCKQENAAVIFTVAASPSRKLTMKCTQLQQHTVLMPLAPTKQHDGDFSAPAEGFFHKQNHMDRMVRKSCGNSKIRQEGRSLPLSEPDIASKCDWRRRRQFTSEDDILYTLHYNDTKLRECWKFVIVVVGTEQAHCACDQRGDTPQTLPGSAPVPGRRWRRNVFSTLVFTK